MLLTFFPAPSEKLRRDVQAVINIKPGMKLLHHRTAYILVMANYIVAGYLTEAVWFHGELMKVLKSGEIIRYIPDILAGRWVQKKTPAGVLQNYFRFRMANPPSGHLSQGGSQSVLNFNPTPATPAEPVVSTEHATCAVSYDD